MRNQPSFLHEIIDIGGSPYEIGLQRGKMFKERLKKEMERLTFGNPYYKELWPKPEEYNLEVIEERAPHLYKDWQKALEKTPDWFREECQGQADGAGPHGPASRRADGGLSMERHPKREVRP